MEKNLALFDQTRYPCTDYQKETEEKERLHAQKKAHRRKNTRVGRKDGQVTAGEGYSGPQKETAGEEEAANKEVIDGNDSL